MEKQLPKNWVETDIESVTEILDNLRKPVSSNERSKRLGVVPYYGATGQAGSINDFIFNEELILVGEDGAPFFDKFKNVAYLINGKSWVNNHAHVLKGKKVLSNKFLLHFFNQFDYTDYVGGTTRLKLNQGSLKSIPFPLPPLPEQHRIVAKLDTLFAQLETIKTSMANIPLLLKDFRQQVLTQAVTGKLTEEWRKGKKLNEWQECPLSDFSDARLGKMLDNAKNSGELVSYLGNINVRWSEIDFSDLKQMKVESKELHKYELLKGDILVCEGGEPGRAAIWKYNRNDVIFQKALHRIRLNENVLPDFFLYNLKIDSQNNKLEQLFTGTTIKHLTGRSFSTYTMLVPQLEEQQEIVNRVESLFAKADAIEQQYKTLKASIDNLPQALLHKAFKGELVPQLESDGDAKDLLEEIKRLKDTTAKVLKNKTNKSTAKKTKNYPEGDGVLGMVAEEHYKK